MMRTHKNVDIVNGAMAPSILSFALPLIAANLLQRMFNAADVVVVGRFVGDNALAAVTSTTSLISLMINLFLGLSMGTNVVAARALGEGERAGVQKAVHTSVLLALLCGVGVMTFGILFSPTLLRWMSSPESVIGQSSLYLRLYFIGVPFHLLYNFGSALLRSGGDTRRPMYYLTVGGALNAALNLVFVLVFHMSVAGVGLATAISHVVSGLLVLRALTKETGALRLDLHRLRLNGKVAGRILRIGIPAGFQAIMVSLSNVIIQSSVNSLGEAVMAGSGASSSIEGFTYGAMEAFYQTSLTFTGQNLGAKKPERIDSARRWCILMVSFVGLAMGGLSCLFNDQLLGIYLRTPEAIAAGKLRLYLVALPYFIVGISNVLIGNMRGMGQSVPPMIISLSFMCGFRLLWIGAVFRAYPTPLALFIAYPITWILTLTGQAINLHFVRRRVYERVRREMQQA